MAQNERYFGPKQKGEVFLSSLCLLSAGGLMYLLLFELGIWLPPDPRSDGTLITGVVILVLLVAAWAALRRQTQLSWDRLARIEDRKTMVYRGPDLLWLVFVEPENESGKARECQLILNGLDSDNGNIVQNVITALIEGARAQGYEVDGPRPTHVGTWFNGINWTFRKT